MIHESFLGDLESGQSKRWEVYAGNTANPSSLHSFHDPGRSNYSRWSINAFALQAVDFAAVNTSVLAAKLIQVRMHEHDRNTCKSNVRRTRASERTG